MNVEIVGNKKALTTVRNKKKELKDLDNHAYQAGNETSSNVVEALDSVDELETDLDQSKESMYKLSYVIRVSAPDLDELKRRCDEVKDFYDDLNVKLVRPRCLKRPPHLSLFHFQLDKRDCQGLSIPFSYFLRC